MTAAASDRLARLNWSGAGEAPHPLMQAHRVPGHVDMHQSGAPLLQVDPFARSFGGNEEPHIATVEGSGGNIALPCLGPALAARQGKVVEAFVTVDEGAAPKKRISLVE